MQSDNLYIVNITVDNDKILRLKCRKITAAPQSGTAVYITLLT